MRKKLRLDDLAVESFEAGEPAPARGTVRAHATGGECTIGCSIDFETCGCASLRFQRECVEVTNDTCYGCPGGGDPTLVAC
ncbi:MAG TPA: hypothetical protein VFT45_02680 [Longimicrobium sp.]|nr:hypothetical protein [Longimicrobium sp.]